MSGIKIGSVLESQLDPTTYMAIVRFNVRQSIQIPSDTSVRVLADGLLGDSYLSIEPGGADGMLAPGDTITRTQDSINIVDLLGRFAFSSGEGSGDGGDDAGASDLE
jgi:phospholipid/cholesterol/gamma-HCH transport system substrate-binding protein